MIKLNEEYFQSPYYFYLKDKGDKISVYFAVENTITESRKNDEVIVVDREIFKIKLFTVKRVQDFRINTFLSESGEKLYIPPSRIPTFSVGNFFKNKVNNYFLDNN